MRAILTYHSVDDSGSVVSIDEAAFRRHVRWLASGRVRVTGVTELLDLPTSADGIALTFDDGFANFASVAWPLLRDHGLPATLFIATDFVGRSNDWARRGHAIPRLPLLDWDEIGRLAEEGVAIGSHSRTHPDLRALPEVVLAEEIEGAASRIRSEVGTAPTVFAYPFGLLDDAAVAAVRSAHALACTAELRALRDHEDPCRVPRLDCLYFRRPGTLEAWGTGRFRGRLRLRAGLRRLRGAFV